MTKHEYRAWAELNNHGRPLLDLFRVPVKPVDHSVDPLAERAERVALQHDHPHGGCSSCYLGGRFDGFALFRGAPLPLP